MALVRQPTEVTFKFKDRARKTTSQMYIGEAGGGPPDPIELGNPNALAPFAFLQEFYDSMKNVSDCVGLGYSITYSWDETDNAILSTYGATPNVERKGVMQFNAQSGAKSIFTFPGMKDACEAPDGKHIIRTGPTTFGGTLATHLQSIHDKLQNGATIGVNTFPVVNYLGSDLDGLIDAYKQTRASNGKG